MRGLRSLLRRVFGLVVLGLIVATPVATMAQEATPAARETQIEHALLDDYVAALNDHDAERVVALYAEDAVVTQAVLNGNTYTGREEIAAWVNDHVAGLPDLTVTVGTVVHDGDILVWEFTYSGSHTGQFPGMPAGQGQAVELQGVRVMELDADGLIAEETVYFDNLAFLTQIEWMSVPTPES